MTTNEAISYLEDEVNTLEQIESHFASMDFEDCPENEKCLRSTVCELEVRRMSINALLYKENDNQAENVSVLHPSDDFICSCCGIELEGWRKVIGDVSSDACAFEEFSFKYCPNCGRKLQPTRYDRGDSVL